MSTAVARLRPSSTFTEPATSDPPRCDRCNGLVDDSEAPSIIRAESGVVSEDHAITRLCVECSIQLAGWIETCPRPKPDAKPSPALPLSQTWGPDWLRQNDAAGRIAAAKQRAAYEEKRRLGIQEEIRECRERRARMLEKCDRELATLFAKLDTPAR